MRMRVLRLGVVGVRMGMRLSISGTGCVIRVPMSRVDIEFHSLDSAPIRPLEVQVAIIAKLQLCQCLLEDGVGHPKVR